MLFVIYGYCGPDNYTSHDGPVLEVQEFSTRAEVTAFKKKWEEDCGFADEDSESSSVTFRVIEGKELKVVPVERVTEYQLEG